MSDGSLKGNRLVAVGMFLLAVSGAIHYSDPHVMRFPILKEPLLIPILDAPLVPPVILAIVAVALVIVGFWRGW